MSDFYSTNVELSMQEKMIFEISQYHASLLFRAMKEAESFAKDLNIDLCACHIELHENVFCQGTNCYLIYFCEEDTLDGDWMDAEGINDVCVYICQDTERLVLITQSR